jgi:hypothetical protein
VNESVILVLAALCDRQSGGGWGEGWWVGFVNRHHDRDATTGATLGATALLLPAQNTHPVRDTCDFEHKRTTPTGSPPQPPPPRPRPIGAIRSIALTIAFCGRWPRVDRSRAATLHGHSDLCVGHTSYHLPTCPTTFEICRFHSTRRAGARATTFVRMFCMMFCRIINVVFHIFAWP